MSTAAHAAFNNGDAVTVRTGNPPTHYRTPVYVQGKTGRVMALCGVFPDAESLAHGGSGQPYKPLYRVEFPQTDLWENYSGPSTDRLQIDIYEQWLESAG